MKLIKKLSFGLLTLSLLPSISMANTYPTQIFYTIINNSNVNLIGIPAHSSTSKSALTFPDRPYAYSLTFGIKNSSVKLCVGVGASNFSSPYVGAYALKTQECAVSVSTQQNSDTDYTVTIIDSK